MADISPLIRPVLSAIITLHSMYEYTCNVVHILTLIFGVKSSLVLGYAAAHASEFPLRNKSTYLFASVLFYFVFICYECQMSQQ